MKNNKIINSLNKINPSNKAKERIWKNINIQLENYCPEERKRNMNKKVILAAVCAIFISATTAFAAYRYMTEDMLAKDMGDNKLSEAFSEESIVSTHTESMGDYKATLLGITSGKNISDSIPEYNGEPLPDRTYAAVAIEKTDGSKMTYDDEVLVTPLIQGLKPWQYNIYTMNGGYSAQLVDGVLYRIVDFNNIEYFSDRQIYIAITDSGFYRKEAYNYDESSGLITPNTNYKGTNILFELNLDKTKADREKAQEYIDGINREMGYDELENSSQAESISTENEYDIEVITGENSEEIIISNK